MTLISPLIAPSQPRPPAVIAEPTDERALRANYHALDRALRRKAFEGVLNLALPNYKTAGVDEAPRLYSRDIAGLKAHFADYVFPTYDFNVYFIRVKGEEARVQSIETNRQYRTIHGRRYGEFVRAVRRDIWLRTPAGWRLAMTYYPKGYVSYLDYVPVRRPSAPK